jgi:hypothetical protein
LHLPSILFKGLKNLGIWGVQALEHVGNIIESGEQRREATVRKFRIVQKEGLRGIPYFWVFPFPGNQKKQGKRMYRMSNKWEASHAWLQ